MIARFCRWWLRHELTLLVVQHQALVTQLYDQIAGQSRKIANLKQQLSDINEMKAAADQILRKAAVRVTL